MPDQQPAYVLHSRPWRESSVIADLFTLHQGRVSVLVHGARKTHGKQPPIRALVQPFTPLMVSYTGQGELRNLVQMDSAGPPLSLAGNTLYSGLYANELLLKLLATDDPQPNLFAYYQTLLSQLADNQAVEPYLRPFEVHLLDELGYHIELDKDLLTAEPVVAERYYQLRPLQGVFVPPLEDDYSVKVPMIKGQILLQLAAGDFTGVEVLKVAKYLARANLDQLLGGQPLHSRRLFQPMLPPKNDT